MSKRNYYRFNQDPWNDEIYKPVKKESDMVDETKTKTKTKLMNVLTFQSMSCLECLLMSGTLPNRLGMCYTTSTV